MPAEWDSVASLRRTQIESGNDLTFSRVFVPLFKNIVADLKPNSILEAGIGTGHLALELRHLSSSYVGVEPSSGMFTEDGRLLKDQNVHLLNTTLENLNTGSSFDLVLVHMCLQAIEDYIEFLRAVRRSLSAGGAFLISIPHPAFFNDYKK